MQSLPPCLSCLSSMLLNDDTVGIKKPDGICLLTFAVDEFPGLFLHPSIFSIKHKRSAENNKWCFIKFLAMIKF